MNYTHKVTRSGVLCSEHTSQALAEKAVGRYVAMSNGKLTAADFKVEPTGRDTGEENTEAFREVKAFDAWLRQNGATECGFIELAPATVRTGLRGAKHAYPAEQKVLFRIADGRLLYWKLDVKGDFRNPGTAVFVAGTDSRVTVQS